jgi:hypothetical protein
MMFPKKPVFNDDIVVTKVLVAKKSMHQGSLFGHISNGGGSVDLGNGYSLQFVRDGSQFVKVQLFQHGLDVKVETQSWQKSKVVIEKAPEKDGPTEVKIEMKNQTKSLL